MTYIYRIIEDATTRSRVKSRNQFDTWIYSSVYEVFSKSTGRGTYKNPEELKEWVEKVHGCKMIRDSTPCRGEYDNVVDQFIFNSYEDYLLLVLKSS